MIVAGGETRNCLLLLIIALGAECGHRPTPQVADAESRETAALGVVERCKTEAKRCQDYAGSPSASTVCDQEFRSCLAGLVQDGGDTAGPEMTVGAPMPRGACIENVRTCLVAMSAPSTCANRASECLEASAKGRTPSPAATEVDQARP
jgi:hypothetical protein